MTSIERQAHFVVGPRFFTDDVTGELMFEFTMDGGNRHGPRPATDKDKKEFPEAYKNRDKDEDGGPARKAAPSKPAESDDHKKLREEQERAKAKKK
jgi:hypothetical protein